MADSRKAGQHPPSATAIADATPPKAWTQVQLGYELDKNVGVIGGAVFEVLWTVAVACAEKVDQDASLRSQSRMGDDLGVVVGTCTAESVNEHDGETSARQIKKPQIPARRFSGERPPRRPGLSAHWSSPEQG